MPLTVGCATMRKRWLWSGIRLAVGTLAGLTLGVWAYSELFSSDTPPRIDPAAWGSDHVGQPIPDYATGDQCLFCHRDKVGPTWSKNRHSLTIRDLDEQSPALAALKEWSEKNVADGKLAGEVRFVMGDQQRQRFLKPAEAYGKLELFSVAWSPARDGEPGKLVSTERPHWDPNQFGASCAGCHTTAVDSKEETFSATALDCYVCHGNVPPEHTDKQEFVYLSAKRKDNARVVTSICAQCHVRTGKSKSTGHPYPNNFVAGDNLFRDFEVDFSDRALENLSVGDRHVLENVRDVVVFGKEAVTCLSCHDVHGRSSKKHHRVPESKYCVNCHQADGISSEVKPFSTHSKTCVY